MQVSNHLRYLDPGAQIGGVEHAGPVWLARILKPQTSFGTPQNHESSASLILQPVPQKMWYILTICPCGLIYVG